MRTILNSIIYNGKYEKLIHEIRPSQKETALLIIILEFQLLHFLKNNDI